MELALQLLRSVQAPQHLLGEAVGEAEANLLQHGLLQPAGAQAQETVRQVMPAAHTAQAEPQCGCSAWPASPEGPSLCCSRPES